MRTIVAQQHKRVTVSATGCGFIPRSGNNVFRTRPYSGVGSIFMGTECLSRFPGSLCLSCYVSSMY